MRCPDPTKNIEARYIGNSQVTGIEIADIIYPFYFLNTPFFWGANFPPKPIFSRFVCWGIDLGTTFSWSLELRFFGIFWGEQKVGGFFLFHAHEVRKTWESFFDYLSWFLDTPPKFNSSPLKSYLPNRKVVCQPPFSGSMLNFGGVFLVDSDNVTIMYCNHQRMKNNKYTFIHIHGSTTGQRN